MYFFIMLRVLINFLCIWLSSNVILTCRIIIIRHQAIKIINFLIKVSDIHKIRSIALLPDYEGNSALGKSLLCIKNLFG